MNNQSAHEPKAKVMSAADVWDDAQEVAEGLRQNLLKAEPVVRLQVPLSVFLSPDWLYQLKSVQSLG